MTKLIPAIAAAFLVTAIATPVFAQAAIQEPGAFAFYHPDADVLAGRQRGSTVRSSECVLRLRRAGA